MEKEGQNVTKAMIWKHVFYALALFNGFLACECALAMAIALAASDAAEVNYQAKSAVLFALFGAVALAIAWVRIKR